MTFSPAHRTSAPSSWRSSPLGMSLRVRLTSITPSPLLSLPLLLIAAGVVQGVDFAPCPYQVHRGVGPGERLGSTILSDGTVFAIGAPGADTVAFGSVESGAIEVWVSGPPGSRFGTALARVGETWCIGAPLDSLPGVPAGVGAGAVHLFFLDRSAGTSTLLPEGVLVGAGLPPGARFGASLSASGPRLVVGAPGAGPAASPTGAVDILRRVGVDWIEEGRLLPPPGESETGFAECLTLSGGLLAVGSPRGSAATLECGVVDLYRLPPSAAAGPVRVARVIDPNGASDDALGAALAFGGGVLAIGAPYRREPGMIASGAVGWLPLSIIAGLSPSGGSVPSLPFIPGLLPPSTTVAPGFGRALGHDGERWWVATPAEEGGAPLGGVVRAYRSLPGGAASSPPEAELSAPSPAAGAGFGAALAVEGGVLIVGAPGDPAGCGGSFGCAAGAVSFWRADGGRDCDGNGVPDRCQIHLDPTLDPTGSGTLETCSFRRGDAHPDGRIDITDAVRLLVDITAPIGAPPGGAGVSPGAGTPCPAAWDANADGAVDLSDPLHLLGHLFDGGPPPPPPYPQCGRHEGALSCTTPCAP